MKQKYKYSIPEFFGVDEWIELPGEHFSAIAAADAAAEHDDNDGDYTILARGGIDRLVVREAESGKETAFRITAESLPHYYAQEIEST